MSVAKEEAEAAIIAAAKTILDNFILISSKIRGEW
jgi:hypothetical protein